jgi:hypothetical protein
MKARFNSMKTLTKFVLVSIFVVLIYSIAEFVSSIIFNVSHDVLTGCIYAFFGTEIAACGFIKIFKIKKEEQL